MTVPPDVNWYALAAIITWFALGLLIGRWWGRRSRR